MFTSLVIAMLAVVGAGAVLWGGIALLSQRPQLAGRAHKQLTDGDERALLERTIRELRVGDIVQRAGTDYLVEGVVRYDEDGHKWQSARLVDGREERWLMVGLERGGTLTVRWLRETKDVHTEGYPPERLIADGTSFSQQTRGTASAQVTGNAGALSVVDAAAPAPMLRCRWWRYETAGPGALVVEQWGDHYRVLRGDVIRPSDVELMPGS